MNVCGIDASMTRTAICCGSGPTAFTMRVFTSTNLGKSVHARMRRLEPLAAAIDAFLKEQRPSLILIEGYSHGSTYSSNVMAEWGGILRWHLVDHVGPDGLKEVAPTTLKKFITGTGKGKKQGMIGHVAAKYGQLFETDDEVDAFSLYQMALACAGVVPPHNQPQRDSVATVMGTTRPVTTSPVEPALF